MAPTAMPTLAPRVRPPVGPVLVDRGVAEGWVMLTGVVEKREPCREIVFPGVGCCWHAPVRAVWTKRHELARYVEKVGSLTVCKEELCALLRQASITFGEINRYCQSTESIVGRI